MKSDIMHVIPTDGYVNNRRSAYPLAEVGTTTYTSNNNYSKLGKCKTNGYTGIVFEFHDKKQRLSFAIGAGARYNKIITNFMLTQALRVGI